MIKQTQEQQPEKEPTLPPVELTDEQKAEQQELYRKYLEQIRRQQCPGCGDTDIV
jgi:uncharacterized protein YnzC (UPF0291/DUF896 family)